MKTVKMKRKEIKGIDDKGGLSYDARHYFWSSHDFSRSRHLSLTQKSERTGHCFRWRHIFGFWMVYRHDHHL
jgi:hypothetical protein